MSSQTQRLLRGYRSGKEGEVTVPFSASIVPPQASVDTLTGVSVCVGGGLSEGRLSWKEGQWEWDSESVAAEKMWHKCIICVQLRVGRLRSETKFKYTYRKRSEKSHKIEQKDIISTRLHPPSPTLNSLRCRANNEQ